MAAGAEFDDRVQDSTLEAFADTIVPGCKRGPDDHAIAGVCDEPGAVEAGALELLNTPATGVTAGLPHLARSLNAHATAYAQARGIALAEDLPAFVALGYDDRVELVEELTAPGHPEKSGWVLLAMFSNMAYDSAAHLSTTEALEAGHPGLIQMGFAKPDSDGLWRFPDYSYGQELAKRHPNTTASGSPE